MDISSLLPLLMNKNGAAGGQNDMMTTMLAEMMKNKTGQQTVNAAESAKGNGESAKSGDMQDELLKMMLSNRGGTKAGGPDMTALLTQMLTQQRNNKQKPAKEAAGFLPIIGIANNEILGKLIKYYIKQSLK